MSELRGDARVALVTGGGRGIGRAIAERLAADGLAVVVNYLRSERDAMETVDAIRHDGGQAFGMRANVAVPEDVDRIFNEAENRFGPVQVLVNNAGWDVASWFVETELPFWRQVVDVNFMSVLLTCRRALPAMLDQRRGRIISIGSATARIGFPTEAVYAGAKGAVNAFSRSLAREVANAGVTVNVVSPGPTETPLTVQFNAEIAANPSFARVFPEGPIDTLTKQIPLGRFGQPGDIAEAVAFLAGPGGTFITGQVLAVDGGFTM